MDIKGIGGENIITYVQNILKKQEQVEQLFTKVKKNIGKLPLVAPAMERHNIMWFLTTNFPLREALTV